jgi:hypothetical protein
MLAREDDMPPAVKQAIAEDLKAMEEDDYVV